MRGKTTLTLLLIVLVLFNGVLARGLRYEEEEDEDWRRWEEREREREESRARREERERKEEGRSEEKRQGRREEYDDDDDKFLLQDVKHVVKTDAGEMRVVKGFQGRFVDRPMHIGFITMEPKSLFIPQYMDSSLILFIRRGEAMVGSMYKDEFVETHLRMGDVYRILAGSAFYLVNNGEGQRLQIVCSIDPSESMGFGTFQSFFIGGGRNPASILSGFDRETLATAFNVSSDELREILTGQQEGPIVFLDEGHAPSLHSNFERHLKSLSDQEEGPNEEKEKEVTWSWRKLLNSFFGEENKKDDKKKSRSRDSYRDSYNIYDDRSPDFQNDYGWSIALDGSDYSPLKHSGIGVYLVNLAAGTMMAPHINPTATEYGIVLSGSGTIQVVYPNGSLAMNTEVNEGDVFMIPRYFPFCQIASRTAPFEFFGFTTSARRNRPQFLVGGNSLLRSLRGPELAMAFGVGDDRLTDFLDAQRESVILPTASVAPPDEMNNAKLKDAIDDVPKAVRSRGSRMIVDFD